IKHNVNKSAANSTWSKVPVAGSSPTPMLPSSLWSATTSPTTVVREAASTSISMTRLNQVFVTTVDETQTLTKSAVIERLIRVMLKNSGRMLPNTPSKSQARTNTLKFNKQDKPR